MEDTTEYIKPRIWVDSYQDKHESNHIHPERSERILSIMKCIHAHKDRVTICENSTQLNTQVQNKFTRSYWSWIDGDTYKTPYTDEIVERGRHMLSDAVDWLLDKSHADKERCGFVLIRPPGHHADNKGRKCLWSIRIIVWYAVERI